jgi:hypothetical chaperone protein
MNNIAFCGLDFGTSNSTIGIYHNGACQLVPMEAGKATIRSAIFYDYDEEVLLYGQEGIDTYLDGASGRLMMALKSVLGSALINDKTMIYNSLVPYSEILGKFIKYLKERAESVAQTELTQVVVGRPVRFHDTDDVKDKAAQDSLESIVRAQGFKDITFQYEPIAAAKTYEQSITSEQLALIVDIGGGTSDFSIIRISPVKNRSNRSEDILANHGIHIGGTDFDKCLSLQKVMPLLGMHSLMRGSSSDIEVPTAYYQDLTTWHTLHILYKADILERVRAIYSAAHDKILLSRLLKVLQNKQGHKILNAVELSKHYLSEHPEVNIDLGFIEETLKSPVTQQDFNFFLSKHSHDLLSTITQTLKDAGVPASSISAIFYTGGSTKIPLIKKSINALFPQAQKVHGDAFGSVGLGLTLYAYQKYYQ